MQRRNWTTDELAYLEANYRHAPAAHIAAVLGRTAGSVHRAAAWRGIARLKRDGELQRLMDIVWSRHTFGWTNKAISEALRTAGHIVSRRRVAGIRRRLGVVSPLCKDPKPACVRSTS